MSSGGGKGKGGASAGGMLDYGNKALELQTGIYNHQRNDNRPFYEAGVGGIGKLSDLMGIGKSTGKYKFGSADVQARYDAALKDPAILKKYKNNPRLIADSFANSGYAYTPEFEETGSSEFGSLLKNFSMDDYQQDPGYQFRLGEGQKALDRQLNARGKTYSPEAAKALMGYNQAMGSQEYGAAYNRFNNDQNNIYNRLASLSGIGQTATGQLGQAAQNYGQSATDLYTGMGNAVTGAGLANQANNSSMFNTLLGAGAQIGSAALLSDERLKENIVPLGFENGHKIYKFNYDPSHPYVRHLNLPTDKTYIGVMASDVEKYVPDAVFEMDGFKRVNYGMLGLTMKELQ